MSDNLIIGAGAIGTVLAVYLSQARRNVRLAVREEDVDSVSRAPGLRVDRVTGRPPLTAPKPPLTTDPTPRAGETVFICVKHRDLASVYAGLPDELAPGVTLIPCLNGVGITRQFRERWPATEVAAMTIMFNAQLLEPLHARITTKPQILLNTTDKELLRLFHRSGVSVRRAEDESVAWGKLLINLANAACALTHTTFKDLLTEPDMKAVFIAMLDEATAVLDAAGVSYDLPVLSYPLYRTMLRHGGPVPWLFAKYNNGLSDMAYPSMVADVERGKATEVEQLNGEIVRLAQSQGKPCPVNAALVEMVHAIEGQPQEDFLSPGALREHLLPAG